MSAGGFFRFIFEAATNGISGPPSESSDCRDYSHKVTIQPEPLFSDILLIEAGFAYNQQVLLISMERMLIVIPAESCKFYSTL